MVKLVVFLFAWWLLIHSGAAQAGETALYALNAFRLNPPVYVPLTGRPLAEVRSLWPEELWAELEAGVPPLAPDPELDALAAARAEAILDSGLPLPADLDAGLAQEMAERGLSASVWHESYALLAFELGLPEEEIEEILVETLMARALLREDEEALLLFPCWTRVGTALEFGEISLEGEVYHAAALVVIVVGDERDDRPELLGRVYGGSLQGELSPLEGATVRLDRWWDEPLSLLSRSWETGLYCLRLDGEPAGYARLQVEAQGWLPFRELVDLPSGVRYRNVVLLPDLEEDGGQS